MYSDADIKHFEDTVLKSVWAYKRAKGQLDSPYPENHRPSVIYHTLYGRPPTNKEHQSILRVMDNKFSGKSPTAGDYSVTIRYRQGVYPYEITDAKDKSHARHKAIDQFLRANEYGVRTQKAANDLFSKGELLIEIDQTR